MTVSEKKEEKMRLSSERTELSAFPRYFASRQRCPHCGDPLIAPEASEFIEGGTIQHFWSCDGCGQDSRTFVRSASH
jgi:uncharacterized protein with PIN domain